MVEELARSDHLGTIRRITNTATPPAIVAAHDYYPFGSEATSPSQDGERMKWAGSERDQQGTPTVQTDDLDYLHARYQTFNLGRFLSLDPVRGDRTRPQSFNLFAYVSNNPINRTDPLGLLEATTTPQASGGLTTMVGDGLCASQDDASDPDCEAYQRKVREEWERLVAAQDRARELFVPDDDGTTHCNQATCWIAAETGNPTGPLTNSRGNPAPANEQAAMLALSGEYREISAGEAQAQANAGVLVIAAYRNTDPSRSGHTATVRPSGVFGDMPPTGGRGPLINDVGRVVLVQHMNWVFKKDADVRFYVPVGR
jgi:RHS repeat-associated protein